MARLWLYSVESAIVCIEDMLDAQCPLQDVILKLLLFSQAVIFEIVVESAKIPKQKFTREKAKIAYLLGLWQQAMEELRSASDFAEDSRYKALDKLAIAKSLLEELAAP